MADPLQPDAFRAAMQVYVRELEAEGNSGLTDNLAGYAADQVKKLKRLLGKRAADPRVQAYALGRAHANNRARPSVADWAAARRWFDPNRDSTAV